MKMAEKEYIEREAALDAILKQPPDAHYPEWYAWGIREIPAADVVEVRHGCWIDNDNGTFTCSVCGGRASKMAWRGRCGAMMDRRKEDEGK